MVLESQHENRLDYRLERGGEAVIMVENIRSYYDVLSRFEPAHETPYTTGPAFMQPESFPSRPSMAEAPQGP